jgi:hypothetical protein
MLVNSLLVISIDLFLYNAEGILGAFSQAGAQAITVLLGNKPRLAVFNPYGSLGTGRHTQSAPVAFCFVYFDYFTRSFHGGSFSFFLSTI